METPEPDLLLLSIYYDIVSNGLVPVSVGQSEALRIRLETHCYLSPVPTGTCTRISDSHAETGNTSIWIDISRVKGIFLTLTAHRTSCQFLALTFSCAWIRCKTQAPFWITMLVRWLT